MLGFAATLLAALIGAIIGSVGAVFVDHWLIQRDEDARRREALAQRYLFFQLQDAAEGLWYRLRNLTSAHGRYVMINDYFETTTLYALGRVLAVERILALEGVYSQLDAAFPELGKFLREHRVDRSLQGINLYQYDRVSLAEAMIEREGEQFRPSTYLEFRKRYEAEGSPEKEWLTPASKAIRSLDNEQMDEGTRAGSLARREPARWRRRRASPHIVPNRNALLRFASPPRWARSRRSSWRWSSPSGFVPRSPDLARDRFSEPRTKLQQGSRR